MELAIHRRHWLAGLLTMVGGIAVATALLLPFREHISIATAGLVLVVPVVATTVVGGVRIGLAAVVVGFLVFDVAFIPPYGTLAVGSGENWVALIVYVLVVLLVARVVARVQQVQSEATRREADVRRVLEMSDLLVTHKPLGELVATVVTTAVEAFGIEGAAVLLPDEPGGHRFEVAASTDPPLLDAELLEIAPTAGRAVSFTHRQGSGSMLRVVPLTASTGALGILVLRGVTTAELDHALVTTFANHVALAIEQAQLRDEMLAARLLVEVDEWRAALLASVAHDLRTPLASIKVAVGDLRDPALGLPPEVRAELLGTVEEQTDRLTRLVSQVLDLWRLEAGALVPHVEPVLLADLVDESIALLQPSVVPSQVRRSFPDDLPALRIDPVLVGQVVANLLENAARHGPPGGAIDLEARSVGGSRVELSVTDHGPGIPPEERDRIFEMFRRGADGGRSGLGLAIAKAFVEAHGGRIHVEAGGGGSGARFVLDLPAVGSGSDRELVGER